MFCIHELKKMGVAPTLEKERSGPYRSKINFAIQVDEKGAKKVVQHKKLKL